MPSAAAERAHDGHVAGIHQAIQDAGIDRDDVAHEAVVHDLLPHLDRRTLAGLDEPGVHSGEAHGRQALSAAGGEETGIHGAVEHHGRHLQRLLVRHAPTLDEAGLGPERLREIARLGAAAMDDDHPDAHLVEHLHLFQEGFERGLALQGAAPRLDDESLPLEQPDVGDRVLQGRHFGGSLADIFHFDPPIRPYV